MVITVEPGCYFCPSLLEPALQDPVLSQFLVEERLRPLMVRKPRPWCCLLSAAVCWLAAALAAALCLLHLLVAAALAASSMAHRKRLPEPPCSEAGGGAWEAAASRLP